MHPFGNQSPGIGCASRYRPRVERRSITDDEYVAGAAKLDEPVARFGQARSVRREHMVGPSDVDRGPLS